MATQRRFKTKGKDISGKGASFPLLQSAGRRRIWLMGYL
jgi:hypothetical protein